MERNSEQLSLISNQFQYDGLKTREENLAAFAKAIVANQTFDLCTWEDTVACMYLADDRVVYNRITLCTMGSTLTKAEYKLLLDCMAREINRQYLSFQPTFLPSDHGFFSPFVCVCRTLFCSSISSAKI